MKAVDSSQRVVAIIQARMGSSRLPGKSLLPLAGKPVIQHVVERIKAVSSIDKVVVATTDAPQDDVLVAALEESGVEVFRGSETDVLGRYAGAVRQYGGSAVVRITGDDPLKDPAVIDMVVRCFLAAEGFFDYVSNTIRPTFPEGQDTEIFRSESLFEIDALAKSLYDREHVTPYFYRHQERFRCFNVVNDIDLSHHRWTLDTEDDLKFFTVVFNALGGPGKIVTMPEVLELLERKPTIARINAAVRRSHCYH